MAVRVVVVDYDPEWPYRFEQIRAAVLAAVGDLALAIEHIGSTAVAGLAAKPIVDVDVVVRAADVGEAVRRLALVGYEHEGDLGVPGRQAFISPIGAPAQHLYLCSEDSPALEAHLRFCDHLRANPVAAAEYGRLKRAAALAVGDDREAYASAKASFIEAALRTA